MTLADLKAKEVTNSVVAQILRENGIELGDKPVIIDIVPIDPEKRKEEFKDIPASMVYVVASVDLGDNDSPRDFEMSHEAVQAELDTMDDLGAEAQGFNTGRMQRARIMLNDDIIEAEGLKKGTILTVNGKDTKIQVLESFRAFRDEQQEIGWTDKDGVFHAKLKQGKPFYRETKLRFASSPHQHRLLPSELKASEVAE